MKGIYVLSIAVLVTFAFGVFVAFSDGNSTRGQRVFAACAACHSLQPDQNMTGPSLAVCGIERRERGEFQSIFIRPQISEHRLERQDARRLDHRSAASCARQ